jgi:hypothetical protein
MSIPLDCLYHYIEDVAKDVYGDVIIYRFWPHGSKKIDDLLPIKDFDWMEHIISTQIFCNDQEPLHWELYNDWVPDNSQWTALLLKNLVKPIFNNFRRYINLYDKSILLHSEQRSSQCEMYQKNNFVLAYYWSHAVISRDWFRFAQHVKQKKSVKKMFLVYNRAWSGTREYRLKFLELLINAQLEKHCKTTVTAIEAELNQHYSQYRFKNPVWQPKVQLENYFPPNNVPSHYSADFDLNDYENTNIEVVLETLFDDDRLHLTEKTLRPIACGQPFILSATAGSLEYLQRYGFKTFKHIWSEEYDLIQDPTERLSCVVELMSKIANWDTATCELKLAQAQEIAEYNKQYFFSQEFFTLINNELRQNLFNALVEVQKTNTAQAWLERRQELLTVDEIEKVISGAVVYPDFDSNPTYWSSYTKENIAKVVAMANQLQNQKNSN